MFSPAERSWVEGRVPGRRDGPRRLGPRKAGRRQARVAGGPGARATAGAVQGRVVYVGPVGDAGWTFAHDQGRKASRPSSAPGGDDLRREGPRGADAERVIRDLAVQGEQIIFATSFGFMEAMLKVAVEFPDMKFEHATGYKTSPTAHLRLEVLRGHVPRRIIAGTMSKTGTLGFVGSFPIPEVLRNINAFTLGRSPSTRRSDGGLGEHLVRPPKEAEAAQSLLNGGADVLLQNTDSTAVLQTAEKNGKLAFGWDSDMSAFAPKAHLASAIVDWSNYYKKAVRDAMEGTWKTERTVWA